MIVVLFAAALVLMMVGALSIFDALLEFVLRERRATSWFWREIAPRETRTLLGKFFGTTLPLGLQARRFGGQRTAAVAECSFGAALTGAGALLLVWATPAV
jgi:hypothetical protein